MRADLEAVISIKRKLRSRKVREGGDIMRNMIRNFLQYLLCIVDKLDALG